MVAARKTALRLALVAGAALAAPATCQAADPIAQASGSNGASPNPSLVGTPILRTDAALVAAANFIDVGDGASAAKPLTAARRYLIRSYVGAKYLILNDPPAPAESASARSAATFRKRARLVVRRNHRKHAQAHASGNGGPAFADSPTAVFNVLTSQYSAVTAAVGMYPDTTGALQGKVKLVLNTAIILRNRLVKAVAVAEPPTPVAGASTVLAHASDAVVAPYAAVMPGLTVFLDDEIQTLKAAKPSLPTAAQADFDAAIAADQKIERLVNTNWPPPPAG